METEKKSKKKVVIIVVAVILALIIITAATLFAIYKIKWEKPKENDATNVTYQPKSSYDFITNTFNEAIQYKELRTNNYNGEYNLSAVLSVDFSENANINSLYSFADCRDLNGFCQYVLERRKEKGDRFSILFSDNGKGGTLKYGSFTATSAENKYKITTGNVYGDDDLAVVELSEGFDEDIFIRNKSDSSIFLSLNYGSMTDATLSSENLKEKDSTLYVFENVYSSDPDAPPNYRLFTVTYIFKKQVTTGPDYNCFNLKYTENSNKINII